MAIQKQYNIKVYNLSGVYQKTLSQKVIMSDISFSSQIDGGQGELRVSLAVEVDSTIVAYNNIIKVYETDENNPFGILIYSGVVTQITRISESGREYIEVTALGLASLLSLVYFFQSGYTFTKNQEVSLSIEDAIDSFSVDYPSLITYDASSIESTGVNANLQFKSTKIIDAIKTLRGVADHWWYVDESGKFQFHPKTGGIGQVTHILTSGDDIDSIKIEEDTENIINKYTIAWASGDVSSQDATSQTAYGVHQKIEINTDIQNSTTAQSIADAMIADNKDPKKRIKIVVNSRYNIEEIKPGHLVTVQNFDYEISSLQIAKIEYNSQNISLELEQLSSLAQEIARI